MSLVIRLSRIGRKKDPKYRIVVAEKRSSRNGKTVDIVGTYDPIPKPYKISVKKEKIIYWIKKGAKMSHTVETLLIKQGIWKN